MQNVWKVGKKDSYLPFKSKIKNFYLDLATVIWEVNKTKQKNLVHSLEELTCLVSIYAGPSCIDEEN